MVLNRRQICAGLGLAVLAPVTLRAAPLREGFLAESGKRSGWPLVLALLVAEDPDAHNRRIAELRRLTGFERPLRYTSTDRHKAEFAAALVDHFLAAGDLRLSAIVAADDLRIWPKVADKGAVIGALRRTLIREAGAADLVVHFRPTLPTGSEPPSHLAELTGFLAGCIRGEATGVGHPLKASLIGHLRQGLGIGSLAEAAGPKLTARRIAIASLAPSVPASTQGSA